MAVSNNGTTVIHEKQIKLQIQSYGIRSDSIDISFTNAEPNGQNSKNDF